MFVFISQITRMVQSKWDTLYIPVCQQQQQRTTLYIVGEEASVTCRISGKFMRLEHQLYITRSLPKLSRRKFATGNKIGYKTNIRVE